jgi:hypothetical protein
MEVKFIDSTDRHLAFEAVARLRDAMDIWSAIDSINWAVERGILPGELAITGIDTKKWRWRADAWVALGQRYGYLPDPRNQPACPDIPGDAAATDGNPNRSSAIGAADSLKERQ